LFHLIQVGISANRSHQPPRIRAFVEFIAKQSPALVRMTGDISRKCPELAFNKYLGLNSPADQFPSLGAKRRTVSDELCLPARQ
jgi:hypothetical protein